MVKIDIRQISSPKPHGMHLVLRQPEERHNHILSDTIVHPFVLIFRTLTWKS